jgi:hypothetical protein
VFDKLKSLKRGTDNRINVRIQKTGEFMKLFQFIKHSLETVHPTFVLQMIIITYIPFSSAFYFPVVLLLVFYGLSPITVHTLTGGLTSLPHTYPQYPYHSISYLHTFKQFHPDLENRLLSTIPYTSP